MSIKDELDRAAKRQLVSQAEERLEIIANVLEILREITIPSDELVLLPDTPMYTASLVNLYSWEIVRHT